MVRTVWHLNYYTKRDITEQHVLFSQQTIYMYIRGTVVRNILTDNC
jgi:hypothetical protein